jgi:branched-chain amino acid transport system ATP-binding protein
MTSAILEVDGLQTSYGASQVLFDISLAVEAGQMRTLLGRNGMGKTTTIRSIFGLTPCRTGTIRFMGHRIDKLPPDKIGQLGLALVPEGRQIFPNLTVKENLIAFARKARAFATDSSEREPWHLDRVYQFFPRLRERERNMGNQLSGGEQQMLAIGRALMTNPSLIVLDEATEGLAPLIREEIWRCLRALREAGQTVLVIDKYVERLISIADEHTIVERGTVAWQGPSSALALDPSIWQRHVGV